MRAGEKRTGYFTRNKAGNLKKCYDVFIIFGVFASFSRRRNTCRISCFYADNLLFVFQEVGLVDYHSHHARDYSSHLAQPHRRRPSLLSEFQPGNERQVHHAYKVYSCLSKVQPLFQMVCLDSFCISLHCHIIYRANITPGYVNVKHLKLHKNNYLI